MSRALARTLVVAALCLGALSACPKPPPPPALWPLPELSLVDQGGAPVTLARLKGRVWVVNFIYTRCSGACPMLTARMKGLRDTLADEGALGGRVGLLSISVDPTADTPARLAEYAAQWGAEASEWIFATGEPSAVQEAVIKGFKTAMGAPPAGEEATDFEILHGQRFVLVDAGGVIRAFYESTPEGIEALSAQVRALSEGL